MVLRAVFIGALVAVACAVFLWVVGRYLYKDYVKKRDDHRRRQALRQGGSGEPNPASGGWQDNGADSAGALGADDAACAICFINPKVMALNPCGHVMCEACAKKMWEVRHSCPSCNARIVSIIRLYA